MEKQTNQQIREVEGVKFLCSTNEEINSGDIYIAEKNTGPKLLTCKKRELTFIVPVENAYCFDICDCMKVIMIA